jgi:thioredoxin reductase (NADPH)
VDFLQLAKNKGAYMAGTDDVLDLLIIGAGPAGLTAAQYGARANLKVLVIEQLAPGGQVLVSDKMENYPGEVQPRSGFDFSQDMHKQAEAFGARFITEAVLSLRKDGKLFTAVLGDGREIQGRAVILATGAVHRTLGLPGEAEFTGRGVSYCATCDGPFFKGKTMLVVGGGDAACDEAQYLSNLSDKIILIHRRDQFRAQQGLAERVMNNPHIEVRLNTKPREIRGDKRVGSVILETTDKGTIYEEAVSAVFIFAGTIPQTALVPDVKKDEAGYIVTDQRMASSIPGLYAAGDVRSSPFRQVVVAAGEGAIAAHCAAEYISTF